MPISLNPEMMREIIMDHYSSPLHKKTPANPSDFVQIRMDSDSCIDDITIYLKLENGKVIDACFDGVACTISTASTDILCDLSIGKTYEEVLNILHQYQNMIYEKPYDPEVLDEAIVFVNTHKQAARIKCATIGCNGIEELIDEECKHEKK
jgi:nitrogen fixation protein NifU and related proteins